MRREQDMWTPSRFEASGQTEIDGVILKGKADRIDVDATGAWRIVDYKTGQPPNFDQRQYGYAPQLPLLALIAQRGGFSADKTPHKLQRWPTGGCRDRAPRLVPSQTRHSTIRKQSCRSTPGCQRPRSVCVRPSRIS
ncbi:RecB family exonuclease [Hankyongella ginsenosidimutans]|uniref:RecB family exonuclease n=1 Tax=Hankyongella ginsenosidimutans TaxID=1763828 RepID=UPI00248226A1|nr:PD-(D/E)XK nuclease family protein [Hankyongella ginsenosidimutans]